MEIASARQWRRLDASYNLTGNRCAKCGTVYFPSRIVCKRCRRESKMEDFNLSGKGSVFSFTKIHVPPDAFKGDAPYVVGIIKSDEGPMVEGHIVENGKEVEIGSRVRAVFRRMFAEGEEGLIHYHYKFEIV